MARTLEEATSALLAALDAVDAAEAALAEAREQAVLLRQEVSMLGVAEPPPPEEGTVEEGPV